MEIYTLTVDDVIAIYRRVTGHDDSPVRPDGLASAVALPMQTMDGRALYSTLFDKAAALLRSIAENQPFLDANKRTAWATAAVFLELNQIEIIASVDEACSLMLDIAAKKVQVDDVAEFLAQHARFRFPTLTRRSPVDSARSQTQRRRFGNGRQQGFSCMKLPTGVILEYYRPNGQIGYTDEGERVDCASCGRTFTALGSASHLWLRIGTYPLGTSAAGLPAVVEVCDHCHGKLAPIAA